MNNSAWDKARIRTAMQIYVDSGKTIPAELSREGQRGILITDELKQFMESVMPGLATVRVHDLKHTFRRRLRAAGVSLETRKVLLGTRMVTSHRTIRHLKSKSYLKLPIVFAGESPAMTLLKRKIA
jgi:integrase